MDSAKGNDSLWKPCVGDRYVFWYTVISPGPSSGLMKKSKILARPGLGPRAGFCMGFERAKPFAVSKGRAFGGAQGRSPARSLTRL